MENIPEVPPLVATIRTLAESAMKRVGSGRKFLELIVNFSQEIKRKYPDATRRRAYHVLIGSTTPDDIDIIEEDFPGDDSVVKFLESLSK